MRDFAEHVRRGACWVIWGICVFLYSVVLLNWLMTLDLDYFPAESDPCVQQLRVLKASGKLSRTTAKAVCTQAAWTTVHSPEAPDGSYEILSLRWGSEGGVTVVFDKAGNYVSSGYGDMNPSKLVRGVHPAEMIPMFLGGGGLILVMLLFSSGKWFYLARNAAIWSLGVWGLYLASAFPPDPLTALWLQKKLTLLGLAVLVGMWGIWDFASLWKQLKAQGERQVA